MRYVQPVLNVYLGVIGLDPVLQMLKATVMVPRFQLTEMQCRLAY